MSERVFKIEWADDLGDMWMNQDNLIVCLRQEGPNITFTVTDVTNKAGGSLVPGADVCHQKPLTFGPKEDDLIAYRVAQHVCDGSDIPEEQLAALDELIERDAQQDSHEGPESSSQGEGRTLRVDGHEVDVQIVPFKSYRKLPVVIQAVKILEPFTVDTLEGTHQGSPGDFLIMGIQGELYPCKPDIFAATYEEVDEFPHERKGLLPCVEQTALEEDL